MVIRFKDFNEHGQGLVVSLCENHKELSEEMKLKVMNLLDKRLKSLSSHLVLQICRLFLSFTVDKPEMMTQVLDRISESLITMLISTQDESHFSVLVHIERLISLGGAKIFQRNFKRFYIYGDEKRYIQDVRLRILTKVTDKTNFGEIFSEICQYSNEINSGLAKAALKALGRLAQKFPKKLDLIFKHLSTCVSLDSEGHGRKYLFDDLVASLRMAVEPLDTSPDKFKITEYSELGPLLSKLGDIGDSLVTSGAKIDFLWLISKFCKYITNSTYFIERYVNLMEEENNRQEQQILEQKPGQVVTSTDEARMLLGNGDRNLLNREKADKGLLMPVSLKLQVMNATFHGFCIKPREMFPVLGKLFAYTIPIENQDGLVREKAKKYYTIMKEDLEGFQKFFKEFFEKPYIDDLSHGRNLSLNEKRNLISSLNSLSIFYNKSVNIFIKPKEHFDTIRKKEGVEIELEINRKNNVDMDIDDYEHNIPEEQALPEESQFNILEFEEIISPPTQNLENHDDFLNMDAPQSHQVQSKEELKNDSINFLEPIETQSQNIFDSKSKIPYKIECLPREMEPEDFQEWWIDLELEIEGSIKPIGPKSLAKDLGEYLEKSNIICMASKDNEDGNQQFYVYAYLGTRDEDLEELKDNSWVLLEINLWRATREVDYTIKASDESNAQMFEGIIKELLSN